MSAGFSKKAIISAPAFEELPDEKSKEFKDIVNKIIAHYELDNAIDMAIAKRVAKHFWYLEHCDLMIKRYGLFNVQDGKVTKMNPIAYFVKQSEAEFRAYIQMLNKKKPEKKQEGPKDLIEMLK